MVGVGGDRDLIGVGPDELCQAGAQRVLIVKVGRAVGTGGRPQADALVFPGLQRFEDVFFGVLAAQAQGVAVHVNEALFYIESVFEVSHGVGAVEGAGKVAGGFKVSHGKISFRMTWNRRDAGADRTRPLPAGGSPFCRSRCVCRKGNLSVLVALARAACSEKVSASVQTTDRAR